MNDQIENHAEARRCFELRLQSIREALVDSAKMDDLLNDCLAVEAKITINIQLSTGGPGDGFGITCDASTREPLHGCHYFMQWGYRKEVPLSPDELADVCAAYGLEDARLYLR